MRILYRLEELRVIIIPQGENLVNIKNTKPAMRLLPYIAGLCATRK